MFELTTLSFLSTLGAAVAVAAFSQPAVWARYFMRVFLGLLLSTGGVHATVFVLGGFGWGWPDLSRARAQFLLVLGGLGIGLFHAGFGWIVSRRKKLLWAGSLLLANPVVLLIPYQYENLRLTAFTLANFLVLTLWLVRTGPTGGDRRGSKNGARLRERELG